MPEAQSVRSVGLLRLLESCDSGGFLPFFLFFKN
jgi:hypothetical protein